MSEGEVPEPEVILDFILNLPAFRGQCSVRGESDGQLVTADTPCHACFHADIDAVDYAIGQPIRERFDLQEVMGRFSMGSHSYTLPEGSRAAFKGKYPQTRIGSREFTLRVLAGMVQDLIRIRHGLPIESGSV